MPRGFKRDNTETAARNFADERSFVSVAGHDVLYGKLDKGKRREEIYLAAHGRCQLQVSPRCWGYGSLATGEWHHKETGVGKHCDCLHNALWSCGPCHRYMHKDRNPRWTSKEKPGLATASRPGEI